jgi:hypothetical protein
MTISGDAVKRDTIDSLDRAEERLRCCHVEVLGQHNVDKVAVAVDGSTAIRQGAADPLDTSRQRANADLDAAFTVLGPAKLARQYWRELRLPIPDGIEAEDGRVLERLLGQVMHGRPTTQPPERYEGGGVREVMSAVQHPAAALVVHLAAIPVAEQAVASRGALRPLHHRGGAASHAVHSAVSS